MIEYAELCITSNFSFFKGGSHPEEYAIRAHELGLSAFSITDENSVAGIVKAHSQLKKMSDILKKNTHSTYPLPRLIPGTHLMTVEGLSITALAKNKTGWKNISRLLTLGNLRTKKGKCIINIYDIVKYGNDIFFLLHKPKEQQNSTYFKSWYKNIKIFIRYFPKAKLVLSPNYDGLDEKNFLNTSNLANKLKIELIASVRPVMHHGSRRRILDILKAIQEKCTIDDLGGKAQINSEQRLRGPKELSKIFSNYEVALQNNKKVYKACNFSLEELTHTYPCEVLNGENPNLRLKKLTENGLIRRYPNGIPNKIRNQSLHELQLIEKLNYAPYFLTVNDIVTFAKSRQILCQGRGSAANSIVCFALGITSVSPNIAAMVFERFVSENRNEPPDIDVDFEHERREEVIQYIYKKFGSNHTALCATIVHYGKKYAIRDIGKAMGFSLEIITFLSSQISNLIDAKDKKAILLEMGIDPLSNRISQSIYLASILNGFPRHLGQHVGGFVISDERLDELMPIENTKMNNRTIISWDKVDIDSLGILKIDVLSLGILTCIRKSFDLIQKFYGIKYTLSNLPPKDQHVYEMLSNADSIGVFQVESRAQINFLPLMKPSCFYDLVIQVAIVRPGPMQGDMVHPYLRRRNGKEKVPGLPKPLHDILNKTLGIPIFQEQAMQMAILCAGFTPEESEVLRRSLTTFNNKNNISEFRTRFINGMTKNFYQKTLAEKCFSQIERFGEYGFPESHAASFALLVYASAWIKYHYPAIFACSLLNSQPMGFYSPFQIINTAKKKNIEVLPLCINKSFWNNSLEHNKNNELSLRIGFRQIKGLSERECNKIISSRKNGFKEIFDIWNQNDLKLSTMSILAKSDCFHSIGLNRRNALWKIKMLKPKHNSSLFRKPTEEELINEKTFKLKNMTIGEIVVEDYKFLQFSLKAHPMELLRPILNKIYNIHPQ